MAVIIPGDVAAAAVASHAKWKVPASVTIAQWALESAWGQSMPPDSNNPFGIKATGDQLYVEVPTHEVVGGERVATVARFRKYDSVADAFDDHGRLLASNPAYAPAMAATDADAFADALTGVYATDPEYGAKLREIMTEHWLYQYDV